ncbi:MAG: (Fe-S)-binding protein, partial [Acidimicrobiia bacterium]|nr:(Fe-S)-binding protein [Acidimicrobiia bacterium]
SSNRVGNYRVHAIFRVGVPRDRCVARVPVVAVQFFATCLVEMLRPEVGAAAQRTLRAAGHDPQAVRGATCCGQPAYNAGYAREARRVARRTLRALGNVDAACVVASGSCATMMSHHWPELFEGTPDADAARGVAARTVELTSFLVGARSPQSQPTSERDAEDGSGNGTAGTEADETRGTNQAGSSDDGEPDGAAVVVHDSCHALRELGAGTTVRRALTEAGHTPVSAGGAERCCGFGGSFSVKLPDVSVAMADEKLDSFVAAGCEQVTSCDLSCLLHLQGRSRRRGLPLRFDHVATLLDHEA